MTSVLVIDDDRSVRPVIEAALREMDVNVLSASSAAEGIRAVEAKHPDVVLLDIMLPDKSGLEIFRELHALAPKVPVVFVTAGGTSETAIEAMKIGAYDYLLKPLDLAKVQEIVGQALEIRRLMNVRVNLPASGVQVDAAAPGDRLVGRSRQMQAVYKAIGRVAPQDATVLISGESGVGKELVARAIYHHSRRSQGKFLAVNCAALTESLLESELFGHEKGAFTGATSLRIGKFEQCSGGTLFLDEVGDMSPLVQSKVLRVLQEQQFERVGGNTTVETDVRLIAATNRDLEKMVAKGEFREDLYYRLNVFMIRIPPLRDRPDDILVLLEWFLGRLRIELGKDVQGISPEALDLLINYRWPGNVRQLQNVLRQALLQASGPVLIRDFLPPELHPEEGAGGGDNGDLPASDLRPLVEQRLRGGCRELYTEVTAMAEALYLLTAVLRATDGNQSKAAEILGITRGFLRKKVRELGIAIDRHVKLNGDPEADEVTAAAGVG